MTAIDEGVLQKTRILNLKLIMLFEYENSAKKIAKAIGIGTVILYKYLGDEPQLSMPITEKTARHMELMLKKEVGYMDVKRKIVPDVDEGNGDEAVSA